MENMKCPLRIKQYTIYKGGSNNQVQDEVIEEFFDCYKEECMAYNKFKYPNCFFFNENKIANHGNSIC